MCSNKYYCLLKKKKKYSTTVRLTQSPTKSISNRLSKANFGDQTYKKHLPTVSLDSKFVL